MAEPILTVEHLVKGYGENTVLDDVSFSVRPGEVVVVVGPSGCGKCLLHGVECKFARPVFIGDVLTVSGTVTEVNETFREITVKAVITNQNGQKVTRGVIRAGVAV